MAIHIENLLALCLEAMKDASESKQQVAALEKQNARLQAENAGLQAHNTRLQAENAGLQAENAGLQVQNDGLQVYCTELQQMMTYREQASVALSNELHTKIHELNREIDALSRANSALMDDVERQGNELLRQQRFQESVPECPLLRSLKNPFSWMMTEGIHGHVTNLAELLQEHQGNMNECRKLEQENATYKLLIDEAVQEEINPKDLQDRQRDISGKIEGCYQKCDVFSKRVESCLKILFQVFASAQEE